MTLGAILKHQCVWLLLLSGHGVAFAGDAGEHVHYMGGTISALPTKTEGFINTKGEEFSCSRVKA